MACRQVARLFVNLELEAFGNYRAQKCLNLSAMSIVRTICRAMERIAPLRLAEKWDNVGLLLEAPTPRPNANQVLLTIDLTPSVLAEAVESKTGVIVAYHPSIFAPLRSFTLSVPLQATLLKCAAQGISVFSPHSSLDAVYGGMNDWLAAGLIQDTPSSQVTILGAEKREPETEKVEGGDGRLVTFGVPLSIEELIRRTKSHLGIDYVQYGSPVSSTGSSHVSNVAICVGSGGDMLSGIDADVYLTGEMQHHAVLAAVAAGKHVILCGHSNTERGYLPTLAEKLKKELSAPDGTSDFVSDLQVMISQADRDPLTTL